MLEMITAVNRKHSATISLPVGVASDGLILRGASGLDPVDAVLTSTEFGGRDGSQPQFARRGSRNIVVAMDLDSRYGGGSPQSLRQILYSVFMPKSEVDLKLNLSTGLEVGISGRVESMHAPLFAKNPRAVVSIICDDPDFVDVELKTGTGEAYQTYVEHDVLYEGTVPAGLHFEVDINGDTTAGSIYFRQLTPEGETRTLEFVAPLIGSDTVIINTRPGQKSAVRRRAGVETSILYGISPESKWPILEPGLNKISLSVPHPRAQSYYEHHHYDRHGGL